MATEVVLNGKEPQEEPTVPTYAEAFPPLQSAGESRVSEAPVKSLRISNVTQVGTLCVCVCVCCVCVCVCGWVGGCNRKPLPSY